MATVRSIGTDALIEIGELDPGEAMTARQSNIVLLRFQNQIDAWAADRLTLSIQTPTTFTLLSGTSTVTVGPTGADVTMQRPVWVNQVNYVNPGSSPAQEVPLGPMDADQYAQLSIKQLSSALPTLYFYQTDNDSILGSFFFWPQVSQNVTIVLYTPQAVGVPATLDSVVIGPPGYQEAFMYQLALRLLTPFGRRVEDVPLIPKMAVDAFANMKKPNVQPGLLGTDAALVPHGGGYNVLTDNYSAPSAH